MTTAIRPADRGAGTFDSSVCKLVTRVRHARYYSPQSVRVQLRRAVMRQIAHFAKPPPTTSQIPPRPPTCHMSYITTHDHSNPRQPPTSKPLTTLLLLPLLLGALTGLSAFLLPAPLPQPGVHPLPRTPDSRPHGSRRIGLLHHRNRLGAATISLRTPRGLRQGLHRRRHGPFVHPIRMSRRRHENRPERHPFPTATHRHPIDGPTLKPPHLPGQQPPGQNRRREQRPEQHNGPPPRLPASPSGHRQKLATGDERESDHLSCLYRSSEHP